MTQEQKEVFRLASLDKWKLEHSDQDLRGKTVHTLDGVPVGRVEDMFVNVERERVAALRLDDNRLIDIDYIDIEDGVPVLLVPAHSIQPAAADLDYTQLTTEHLPRSEAEVDPARSRRTTFGRAYGV